jgi:hypothetical protein
MPSTTPKNASIEKILSPSAGQLFCQQGGVVACFPLHL